MGPPIVLLVHGPDRTNRDGSGRQSCYRCIDGLIKVHVVKFDDLRFDSAKSGFPDRSAAAVLVF